MHDSISKSKLESQEVVELRYEKSRLKLAPGVGCNPFFLELNGESILAGNERIEDIEKDVLCRGDFLAPFPNRVSDGKYVFEGKEYQLVANETARGHALHGFLMKKQFELIQKSEESDKSFAEFKTTISNDEFQGYPFNLEIKIGFLLKDTELTITMTGKNIGAQNAPYGVGWHPYLTAGKKIDECLIQIPAKSIKETSETKLLIPTGKHLLNEFGTDLKILGATQFDTCFADLTGRIVKFDGIELWMDETMDYLQIYTPEDRMSIAIEPMSCAPDAYNNKLGLISLAPGQEISHTFGVRLVQK